MVANGCNIGVRELMARHWLGYRNWYMALPKIEGPTHQSSGTMTLTEIACSPLSKPLLGASECPPIGLVSATSLDTATAPSHVSLALERKSTQNVLGAPPKTVPVVDAAVPSAALAPLRNGYSLYHHLSGTVRLAQKDSVILRQPPRPSYE
jgi:hypothetical protein